MSARATTRDELCRSNLAGPTRRLVDIKCNGQRKVHFMGAGTRERDAVRAVREGTRGVTVEARWFARVGVERTITTRRASERVISPFGPRRAAARRTRARLLGGQRPLVASGRASVLRRRSVSEYS